MENFIELTQTDGTKINIVPDKVKAMIGLHGFTHITMTVDSYWEVTETPAEIDAKIAEWKKRNRVENTSSSTDSLIVANLRAHLEALNNEYAESEIISYAKQIRNKILLLEEIHSLQKPV